MRWEFRVDATNWGETQKIIEAIHKMPLDGVTSRRDADEVNLNLWSLTNVLSRCPLPPVNSAVPMAAFVLVFLCTRLPCCFIRGRHD